jgi:hypothetical protein
LLILVWLIVNILALIFIRTNETGNSTPEKNW